MSYIHIYTYTHLHTYTHILTYTYTSVQCTPERPDDVITTDYYYIITKVNKLILM